MAACLVSTRGLAYPATCQSSADQVCGESAIALRSSLGLEVVEAHIDGPE